MVVSILNMRHQTPVAKRTVNPVYAAKYATFDYPLYLSLADKHGVVECIIGDKDWMSKDYLGEVSLPLEDWFVDRANGTDRTFASTIRVKRCVFSIFRPARLLTSILFLQPFSVNLVSTRANTYATRIVPPVFSLVLGSCETAVIVWLRSFGGVLRFRGKFFRLSIIPTTLSTPLVSSLPAQYTIRGCRASGRRSATQG